MVREKVSNESPRDRFKRLATNRTNRILEDLRILGNCSNQQLYEYTEEDIEAIFKVINKQLKKVRLMFDNPKSSEFSL
jgi:hypothetical protein